MDSAIFSVCFITLICSLIITTFSISNIQNAKTRSYQIARSVNQNAIIEVSQLESVDENEMVEIWLKNLSLTSGLNIEELEIEFYYINTKPACYVVTVKNFYKGLKLSQQGFQKLVSSITILKEKSVD